MNNTNKLYDLVIYIGRFQPFHNGHCAAYNKAFELSDNVLSLIGSSICPRTIRNPWNYDERRTIIRDTILPHLDEQQQTLQIEGLRDYTYNDNKWVEQVGLKVNNAIKRFGGDTFAALGGKPKIAVIGHDKDHTSSYLNYFPQWDFIEVEAYPSESDIIDSTRIRQLMFTGKVSFTDSVVPGDQVRKFMRSKHFHELAAEWEYIENYKKAASVAPHETQYITVDAVVEQSGHILLVRAKVFGLYRAGSLTRTNVSLKVLSVSLLKRQDLRCLRRYYEVLSETRITLMIRIAHCVAEPLHMPSTLSWMTQQNYHAQKPAVMQQKHIGSHLQSLQKCRALCLRIITT